jgi:(p)ppGpp synthase/HD superfamily hydrolase
MSHVTITLPDGSSRAVSAGAPVRDVAAAISPRLADAALAATVDDRMVDLSHPLDHDARVVALRSKGLYLRPGTYEYGIHMILANMRDKTRDIVWRPDQWQL